MKELNPNIKVSILVPCYNVESYISQCLDSILGQTLKDIEVICINDGSTDSTYEILRKYQKRDSRIRVLNKENTGYGDSMNRGLDLVRGEYIGIVESDDFVDSDMYENLYTVAIEKDLELARCCYYFYENGVDRAELYPFVPKGICFTPLENTSPFYQSPSIWVNLYKTTWLREKKIRFLPTPGASYQDTSFSFKCYFECTKFLMINKCSLHYRQHPNSSVKSNAKVFSVCDEWREIWRWVNNNKEKANGIRNDILELQMLTYRWNFLRLYPSKERTEFLLNWSNEFNSHINEGFSFSTCSNLRKFENIVLLHAPYLYPFFAKLYKFLTR